MANTPHSVAMTFEVDAQQAQDHMFDHRCQHVSSQQGAINIFTDGSVDPTTWPQLRSNTFV